MSISRDPPWPPTPPNPPGTPCHASPGFCSPRQRNQGTPEKRRAAAALLCFQVAKRNTPGTKEQSPHFFLNVQNYSGLMKTPVEMAPGQDFHREAFQQREPPGGGGHPASGARAEGRLRPAGAPGPPVPAGGLAPALHNGAAGASGLGPQGPPTGCLLCPVSSPAPESFPLSAKLRWASLSALHLPNYSHLFAHLWALLVYRLLEDRDCVPHHCVSKAWHIASTQKHPCRISE